MPGRSKCVDPSRAELLQRLGNLEQRLRRDWASEAPPVPRALAPYRQAWLETLSCPTRSATLEELTQAISRGRPTVVGDFHPLRRARRSLSSLLRKLPSDGRPGLLLELLPAEIVVPARDALNLDVQLVDGRSLRSAFRNTLRAVARRDGLVAGAWVAGAPERRDEVAARAWQGLAREHPGSQWFLFFGDWHLADAHLPEHLRSVGADPVVLHQSPEPLWERQTGRPREEVLELGHGHWAWLHTPPLTHWAAALQNLHPEDPERGAEITEELCEVLTDNLAQVLAVAQPTGRLSVWPRDSWAAFHAILPISERHALSPDAPPRSVVVHPHLPAVWTDRVPSLNPLIEAAAQTIVCDHPLAARRDLAGRLSCRAFLRVWAALLNPFLLPPRTAETVQRLFPGEDTSLLAAQVDGLARKWQEGERPFLDSRTRLAAIEVYGTRLGSAWASCPETGSSFLRELLEQDSEPVNWEELIATIRAA